MKRAPEEIETVRLLLRRPRVNDADAVFSRYASDPDVTRYLSWPRHRSVQDTRLFIGYSDAEWERWGCGPYLIIDKAEGRRTKAETERPTVESETLKAEGQTLKAEGRRTKAETDKTNADTERPKADTERPKAEGQTSKAEGPRTKAEIERPKIESEPLKAEGARTAAGNVTTVRRAALLGSTGLSFESPTRAMTGYVLAKDAWGKGYATEALGAMIELARALGVTHLFALCHADHRPSWRVLEKGGLTREPEISEFEFPNLAPGRFRTLRYSINL